MTASRLRRFAAFAALLAIFTLASAELTSHRHALDETDLVAHAIAEPDSPHANTPHQPDHLEAGRNAEHRACVDCLLSALSRGFASAPAALAIPLPRLVATVAPTATLRFTPTFEDAAPRGPPSAA